MKTFTKFIFILVLVIGINIEKYYAQSGWQWAKSAGSTGVELTSGTVVDASGNLYALGWYTSANLTFGSNTLVNGGTSSSDIFLTKFDANGNVLWAKSYGGADGEIGSAVALDPSGNILITGWYTSASITIGSFTLTNTAIGSSDVFIAKIDPSGTPLWAKGAGGTLADRGNGIAVDALGNVYTTGAFMSPTINFGSGALTNGGSGTNDFFVAKHDAAGNSLWSRSAGGANPDMGYAASVDSLNNVYITGIFSSSNINFGTGAMTNAGSATQDLFVVKYNASGTAVWSDRSGGVQDETGYAITVRSNGVFLTGGFNSTSVSFGTNTLTNSSTGTSDILLAKYDLNGNVVWATRSGGTDSEAGYGITTDSQGNVFLCGYFASGSIGFGSNTINNSSVGYKDLFVANFNNNGTTLWAIAAGNVYDESANCIATTASGANIYIGGMFNSPSVVFGSTTVFKGCGDDVLVAKLMAPVSGINEWHNLEELSGYPNPTSGKFFVEGEGQILFYNTVGEMVLTKKLMDNGTVSQNELDLSSFSKGIYFYKILSGKSMKQGRVVVE